MYELVVQEGCFFDLRLLKLKSLWGGLLV